LHEKILNEKTETYIGTNDIERRGKRRKETVLLNKIIKDGNSINNNDENEINKKNTYFNIAQLIINS